MRAADFLREDQEESVFDLPENAVEYFDVELQSNNFRLQFVKCAARKFQMALKDAQKLSNQE